MTEASSVVTSTPCLAQVAEHLAPASASAQVDANPTLPINYPVSRLQFDANHCIDDLRVLKVAVVGAGLAGINAGILLPAKVPRIDLTIFEKNSDVSGVWLENIYPGVRCDIPAHVYQSTFSPNTQWSEQFAGGSEIRDYWQSHARNHDVYRYVKFRHRVDEASWDDSVSQWHLRVQDLDAGSATVHQFDFVIFALGRFNTWKLPEYPGIDEYKGHLRHTSNWDPNHDPTGKKVAVIGNGASGVQIVPNLQLISSHVTHFARNPTWIAASWARDDRTFEPQPFTDEERESFKDPETYLKFRKALEERYWRKFRGLIRGSKENSGMREFFIDVMKKRVEAKPELLDGLIPDFSPHCRRLTPAPGYLESLTKENVDLVRTPIKRFTPKGIETVDGKEHEFDAIFCATGAHTDLVPPFPVKARGVNLKEAWKPGGKWGFPYTYLGSATPGFPNLFFLLGPHGAGPSGTGPFAVETAVTYYAKILRKASSQGIKTITPLKEAADDFVDYCDAFFPTTVLTDNCSSWNNGGIPGARIHGIWPGSAAHLVLAKQDPRWEDWEYEHISTSGNRFAYYGNGYARGEIDESTDLVSYLKPPDQEVNLKDLHESWWDLPGLTKKDL
ncbi:FAD/NAD(P)-binding domain-containing protein [Polyplosphaeria fusca]|uniref:FAD/NAD(P)-binding domain-containing protein n=1 Tax=Polyplosphaeria fusca TaxID=682080 RepID=A0A9P4QP86_9PLEO|nr:FAD/NAD(P)-binding domain-containing protein [Polyplosphaeria fusca]